MLLKTVPGQMVAPAAFSASVQWVDEGQSSKLLEELFAKEDSFIIRCVEGPYTKYGSEVRRQANPRKTEL